MQAPWDLFPVLAFPPLLTYALMPAASTAFEWVMPDQRPDPILLPTPAASLPASLVPALSAVSRAQSRTARLLTSLLRPGTRVACRPGCTRGRSARRAPRTPGASRVSLPARPPAPPPARQPASQPSSLPHPGFTLCLCMWLRISGSQRAPAVDARPAAAENTTNLGPQRCPISRPFPACRRRAGAGGLWRRGHGCCPG